MSRVLELRGQPIGIDPTDSAIVTLKAGDTPLPPSQATAVAVSLRDIPQFVQGVGQAELISVEPLSWQSGSAWVRSVGQNDWRRLEHRRVSDGYLPVSGAARVAGRLDFGVAPGQIVLGRAAVEVLGLRAPAVGQELEVQGQPGLYEVIGVAEDVTDGWLMPVATVYTPWALDRAFTSVTVLCKLSPGASPAEILAKVRRYIESRHPELAVVTARTLREQVRHLQYPQTTSAAFVISVVIVALVLAVASTYGLTAARLNRRRREVGIRMALGASRAALIRSLWLSGQVEVAVAAAAGALLGIALSAPLIELMRVGPSASWIILAGASQAIVCLASACGAALPLARALRQKPLELLQRES